MTAHGPLPCRQLAGAFAAEVPNLDLAGPLDDGQVQAIHQLLLDYRVLVLRNQNLSPAQQVTFARRLGQPTPAHPVVGGTTEHPEILVLDAAAGGKNARWHTDVTFVAAPPRMSVLYAETVPEFGGDTQWADMRTAYEMLAGPLQDLVAQLDAVHRISPLAYWGEPFDSALTRQDAAALAIKAAQLPAVVHPVVRVHPDSGCPGLFVNPGFTTHVVGLSRIESENLLALLYAHATQPEFVYRHQWRQGDVMMWDNQATMHYAIDDYGDAPRTMRRVTLRGEPAVGRNGTISHVAQDPLIAVR
ncbi:MAG: taurine dioxygenase [Acidimicrobiia bacterium]|nr:taurine dioxygenase [Acidimicrobiia bacterium]